MKSLSLAVALATLVLGVATAKAGDARRIVSVGGDVTEIVYALGAGDRLVARDSTSTFPPEAARLPDAGYIRALSAEGVLSMLPDAILAADGAGPPEQLEALKASGVSVTMVPGGHDASAIIRKIEAVGAFLGRPREASVLAATVKDDLEKAMSAAHRPQAEQRRVLFILSMAGGKIVAAGEGSSAEAILSMAGARNAVAGFKGFKAITAEAITEAKPDAILVMAHADHAAATDEIRKNPALAQSPAVLNDRIIRMDGLTLLGFGPRTASAVRALSAALYGDGS